MKRRGAALAALGMGLILLYLALSLAHVGKFGAPTDIGGGLIPLAGLILVAVGVFHGRADR